MRSEVSGVRSSWLASATSRRWRSREAPRASSIWLNAVASRATSSSPSTAQRSQVLGHRDVLDPGGEPAHGAAARCGPPASRRAAPPARRARRRRTAPRRASPASGRWGPAAGRGSARRRCWPARSRPGTARPRRVTRVRTDRLALAGRDLVLRAAEREVGDVVAGDGAPSAVMKMIRTSAAPSIQAGAPSAVISDSVVKAVALCARLSSDWSSELIICWRITTKAVKRHDGDREADRERGEHGDARGERPAVVPAPVGPGGAAAHDSFST